MDSNLSSDIRFSFQIAFNTLCNHRDSWWWCQLLVVVVSAIGGGGGGMLAVNAFSSFRRVSKYSM